MESPFIPKIGDNFDSKYCNAPEKIGNETREKYESYLRDEKYKDVFKDFYYYYNDMDENDKFNTKEKKLYNPHLSLITNTQNNNQDQSVKQKEKINEVSNIDTKFKKIKAMSSSGSTGSLIRQYRQSSSIGVTSNSTSSSFVFRKSGSTSNLKY